MSRRAALAVLAVAAGGAAAGCTPAQERHRVHRRRVEMKVDPDVAVAADALAGQKAVLELIAATRQRHKGLARVLMPALTTQQAHVAVLARAVPDDVSPSPSTSPSPSPSGPDRRTSVPGDQGRALEKVVRAEQDLRTSTKRLAFNAESGAFARILGSMAAAAAQHAAVLETARVAGRAGS
jgi:hypothetical protein